MSAVSEQSKAVVKQLAELYKNGGLDANIGVKGDYEGIGHCILGYRSGELQSAAERKADYVIRVK